MKLSLSFHGTYAEIAGWILQWRDGVSFDVVVEYFFPEYRVARVVVGAGGSLVFDVDAPPNRVSLHLGTADLSAKSALGFVDKNPAGLSIIVGRQTDEGLRETLAGATSGDRSAMKVWREFLARAERSLKAGAWQVNRMNGDRSRVDDHLYTEGARRLQDAGVPALGPSDWILYELD